MTVKLEKMEELKLAMVVVTLVLLKMIPYVSEEQHQVLIHVNLVLIQLLLMQLKILVKLYVEMERNLALEKNETMEMM